MSSWKLRFLRGGLALLVVRVLSLVIMILMMRAMAQHMDKAQFAAFVVATNLVFTLNLIGMMGMNQSVIRLVAGSHHGASRIELARIFRRIALLTLAGGGAAGLLGYGALEAGIGSWLNLDSRIYLSIAVGSLLLAGHKMISVSLRSLHSVIFSGVWDGRLGGPIPNAIFLLAVVLAGSALTTASSAVWLLNLSLLVTLPLAWWTWRRVWSTARTDEMALEATVVQASASSQGDGCLPFRDIMLFSLPYLLSQLSSFIAGEGDIYIAQSYFEDEQAAEFGAARRLVLYMQQPIAILTFTLSSSFAELYARGNISELQKVVRGSGLILSLTMLPMLFIAMIFPDTIMALLFRDDYRTGGAVLFVLLIGQVINCLTGQCGQVLLMAGKTKIPVMVHCGGVVVLFSIGIPVAKHFGIMGLATVSTIILSAQNIIIWLTVKGLIGIWTHPSLDFSMLAKLRRLSKTGPSDSDGTVSTKRSIG